MSKLIYLLFLIFPVVTIACGSFGVKELSIDGFQEYIELFELESIKQGHPLKIDNLIIVKGDLTKQKIIGLCQRTPHYPPAITIDSTYWDNATPEAKEWLVFHELGHCILNRPHREDRLSQTNCVSSMMYPKAEYYCYYNLRSYYIKELFNTP